MTKQVIANLSLTLFLLIALVGSRAWAATSGVTITAATGGTNILADTAASGPAPAWTTLGPITLAETASTDFTNGDNVILILKTPAGFEFNSAAVPSVTFIASRNIQSAAAAITDPSTLTITLTVSGAAALDTLIIGNPTPLQVRPTAATPLATGKHLYAPPTGGGTAGIKGITTSADGSSGSNFGTLTEVAGAATQLAFGVQPTNTVAGVAIKPSVTVRILDQFGNLCPKTNSVTVAIGNNPAGGTLSGTKTVLASAGVATFSTLWIDNAGTGYTLAAGASGLTGATSTPFNITPAPAKVLIITRQPSATATAGQPFAIQPVVAAQDIFGTTVTNYTNAIIAIETLGGNLNGTTTAKTVIPTNGVATFTGLFVTNAASGVTLTFSSGSLTLATSSIIDVSPAPASKLLVKRQPSAVATAGVVFTNQPQVAAEDIYGNPIASWTNAITAVETAGGYLNATTNVQTVAPASGVATFSGLFVTNKTTAARLTFTSGALTPALSTNINVKAAAIASLNVETLGNGAGTVVPAQAIASGSSLKVYATTRDAFGNFIANPSSTWALAAVTGGVVSSDLSPATGTNTTFTGHAAGGAQIQAVYTSFTAYSGRITVGTGPSRLVFLTAPQSLTAGVASDLMTVQQQDDAGDLVNTTTDRIVTLSSTSAGGTFRDAANQATLVSVTIPAGASTASFLYRDTLPGTPTLTAASTSPTTLTAGTQVETVAPGTLDHYAVRAPAPQNAAAAFATTVVAQDAFNNSVTNDSSTVVTLTGTGSVQFDGNGDAVYGDNTGTLTNGALTISTRDNAAESVTLTATDPNGKTGSFTLLIGPAAASGDYRSAASGAWNSAATWQTNNGAAWVAASRPPTNSSVGMVTVLSGHTVTNAATVTVDQAVVQSGGQVNVNSGVTLTLAAGTGADLDVFGTLRNAGTVSLNAGATVVVEFGGAYQHNQDGGTIPAATWATGATCAITGEGSSGATPAGLNQTFYNFAWNSPGQTKDAGLNGGLTNVSGTFTIASTGTKTLRLTSSASFTLAIGGDLACTGGTLDLSQGSGVATLQVAGDLTVASPGVITESGSSTTSTIFFNGSSLQSFSNTGTIQNTVNFTVNPGAALDLGASYITGAGKFTLSSGAILGVGDTNGITASGASGNIQSSGTRTFSTGASYLYDGLAAQAAGSGLPLTVSNLTVANSAGVIFSAAPTVNGTFSLADTALANLAFAGSAPVAALTIGSFSKAAGTWGSSNSIATYQDDHFQGTGVLNVAAGGATTTTALASSLNPSEYGDSLTFTATVTGTAPSGTVAFYDGTNALGANTLDGASQATLDIATLSAAGSPHSIQAVYSGDINNRSSTNSLFSQAVTPAPVMAFITVSGKTYDGTTAAAITDRALAGVVPGDDVSLGTNGAATFLDKDAGFGKDVSITGLSLTGAAAGNYVLDPPTAVAAADITPALLTVTANNLSRPVGAPNPDFIASYSGFVNGETLANSGVTGSPDLTTTADSISPPGPYPITAAQGTLDANNYTFSFVDGVLTVTAANGLFSDDFARPTDPGTLAPWVVHSGNWAVTGGALLGGTNSPFGYGFAYLTNNWTSYSVQARVQFPAGAYGGGLGGCLDPATGAHYAAWVYPEGSPGGSSVLKLIKFQSWSGFGYTNSSSTPMQQVPLPGVGTNWHSLQLAFQSGQITVSFDGSQMISVTDAEPVPYSSGGISLDMWTDATPYVMAADDVQVVALAADQTISFGPLPDRTYGDPSFDLNATASSGLPVTFSILSGPATNSGNTVTLTGAGQVTVRASQSGSAGYNPAPNVDQSFTVNPSVQTPVTLGIHNNGGGSVTVSFSGTPGAQYVVQAKGALPPATAWDNVSTNTAGTDGQWTFTDSTAPRPARFYRSARP